MIEEEKDKVHEAPSSEDSQGNQDKQDEYVGPASDDPGVPEDPGKGPGGG